MNALVSGLKKRIDALPDTGRPIVIAIDGNCTAGKTTLASLLETEYDCNVFHMDDFFLRPGQRTPERYAQPGGNVDYERFWEEVLLPLKNGGPFAYRLFSCSTFTLGDPVAVAPKQLNIVEGTYCMHPYFGDVYDLRIFLSVAPQLQKERIFRRPAFLHERFFREWIPMEQQYFDTFRIPEQADLQVDMTQYQY